MFDPDELQRVVQTGVLVLRREIAWDKDGSIKPKFRILPERIIAAEQRLFHRLADAASNAD